MSQQRSKERDPPPKKKDQSEVSAPPVLRAEAVVKGLEGLVHSIGELRIEAMLRAVEGSIDNQTKRTHMPQRTLTAAAALDQIAKLRDIKSRLTNEEDAAAKEIFDIRERVILATLQDFDDDFDKWLNG